MPFRTGPHPTFDSAYAIQKLCQSRLIRHRHSKPAHPRERLKYYISLTLQTLYTTPRLCRRQPFRWTLRAMGSQRPHLHYLSIATYRP